MGMRMPETCWSVFKRQVMNLRICCIWLVDSVENKDLSRDGQNCNEIWTRHLPNARLQHYHYINLFSPISFRKNTYTSQWPKLSPYRHINPGVRKSSTPGHVDNWFFMSAPNICGSSVQNIRPATFLAPAIPKWHLDVWKICAPPRDAQYMQHKRISSQKMLSDY
jgi:hypothetical protein